VSDAAKGQGDAGCQLYLIGPPGFDPEQFAPDLDAALAEGGAAAFLLHAAQQGAARALQQVCAGRTAFLIEDDLELAMRLGADGTHLTDPSKVRDGRARLGPDRILGASCGHSRHAAMLAGEDGADYIAFGEAGFGLQPPLLDLLAWWSGIFVLPCLALGVFDGASCGPVARAGADFIGVSDAVWRHPDGAAAGVRSIRDAIAGA
jgi:thiamine-phosphate pyrophosphorylase